MATKIELEEEVEQLEDLCAALVDILTDPDVSDGEKVALARELLDVDEEE